MVLSMSRPWKHPKTGVYWLRRRVPARLVAAVGKTEEKQTLGTKDPEEAKRLFVVAMSDVELRWANLSRGAAVVLTERDTDAIAQTLYTEFLATHRDNPSEQRFWNPDIGQLCFAVLSREELSLLSSDPWRVDDPYFARFQLEEWCKQVANGLIGSRGLPSTQINQSRMARSVAKALQAASLELKVLERGQFQTGVFNRPESSMPLPATQTVSDSPVPLSQLFDGWAAERQPAAKTRYTVERVLLQLSEFVGHDDATRLTTSKLLEWKSALLADGISARTVKATKFGLLKPILQWGVDNEKLVSNPAEKITISTTRKAGEGRRSFTDKEAATVLQAATASGKAYLRWVPWICAYTGARISEVCQLRQEDVIEVEGLWCLKFAPEAGSLKNSNSERLVPLHQKIAGAGFLQFVEKRQSGPLFDELLPDRFGNRGGSGTKLIGRWVRDLGIEDPRISPSHSWRHRFKTLGRRHGLALDIVNAMTGHGRKDVAASYGEFEPSALYRELAKLP